MSYPAVPAWQAVPPPPPPPPPPRRSTGSLVLAAIVGFLLAGAIATVLAAVKVLPGQHSGSSGASRVTVTLPATVGSYRRFADVPINQQPRAKANVDGTTADNMRTAADLSAAHGGAAAAVDRYSDDKLETIFSVWVVRDRTTAPVVPYADPARLGLARPPQEIQHLGQVDCVVTNSPTAAPTGATATPTPASDSVYVGQCLRSVDGLTVAVVAPIGDIEHHPDAVAGLVNVVWDQLR